MRSPHRWRAIPQLGAFGEPEGGDPKVPAHRQPPKADVSAAADCRLIPALVGCGAS